MNFLLSLLTFLSSAPLSFAYPAPPQTSPGSCTSLVNCLAEAGVETYTSASVFEWPTIIEPFNLRVPVQPAALVLPKTPTEVSSSLKCAKLYGVKVQPRGGGHSYASFGLGGKDGSLVVDMNRFNTVDVDATTYIATVGSGVRLGNMATILYQNGHRAMPHGTCPGVGVGGHATLGGYGLTSRMWGMTVDRVVKLDVVLVDGTIKTISPDADPELFWAFKGAANSFGVVTYFHFKTEAAPENAVTFTVTIPDNMKATVAQRVNIYQAMQKYGVTAPGEMAMQLSLSNTNFGVTGVFWGSRPDYEAAVQPFIDMLPAGTTVAGTDAGWIATLIGQSGTATLEVPLTGYDEHNTFFAKSLFSSQKRPLTDTQLTSFFTFIADHGSTSGYNWWILSDMYGGKINDVSLCSACVSHRDSLYSFQFYSDTVNNAPYPPAGIPYMNAMVASLTSDMKPEEIKAYTCYVDPSLSAEEAHMQYYGNDAWDGTPGAEGRLDRLLRIKNEVDPEKILWNPQAIGA